MNLSMSVEYVAIESVSVGESLGACTLSHTDNSMLLWVKYATLCQNNTQQVSNS